MVALTMPERWDELSPLLDELLLLGTTGRAQRLDVLAATDAALAEQLRSLLAQESTIDRHRFLATGGGSPAAAPALAGQQIGAYRLERVIGTGGMGVVWLARRNDGRFDGAAAVKLINPALLGVHGAQRIEQEGRLLARLQHAGIARLLDAGCTPEGTPYLLLEHIVGQPIDAWCDARPRDLPARLKLFLQVLDAVAHAHANLVLHRDLKPSNILVTPEGQVKLLDFGIARLLEEPGAPAAESQLTAPTSRAFTPDHAAPEQVQGQAMSTAVDVYALGVLLYGLLAGAHPTSDPLHTPAQRLQAVIEREPRRMSDAAQRRTTPAPWAAALRGDLDNIVAKALRKDPAERYATVRELADDLRRHLRHEPVSARADSVAYRLAKFLRRHRMGVASAGLVTAAVIAGLAGTWLQSARAQRERDLAIEQLTHAEAAQEFLTFLLGDTGDQKISAVELLDKARLMADLQFAHDAAPRARLQLLLADMHSQLDLQDQTTELLKKAQASAAEAGNRALQARADCGLASEIGSEPDNQRAGRIFTAAIGLLTPDRLDERSALASCLHSRSIREYEMDELDAAVADSQNALKVLGAPRPGQRAFALHVHSQLAGARAKQGDIAGSIDELKRITAEFEALGRGQTEGARTQLNNRGVMLDRAGQALQALAVFDTALPTGQDIEKLGQYEASAATLSNRAQQLLGVGRIAESVASFQKALALADSRGDMRTRVYTVAGYTHCELPEVVMCERRVDDARAKLASFAPPNHATFASIDMVAATYAQLRHDARRARELLRHAVAVHDAQAVKAPRRSRALAMLARVEIELGDLDSAEVHAEEAVRDARAHLRGFATSEWLGRALLSRAAVLRARGADAAPVAAQALEQLRATVGDDAPLTKEALALAGPRG